MILSLTKDHDHIAVQFLQDFVKPINITLNCIRLFSITVGEDHGFKIFYHQQKGHKWMEQLCY